MPVIPRVPHPVPPPAVRLRSVTVHVDGSPALVDVDLDVAFGELTVIVGPNGAGKSTLLDIVAGTRPPTAGSRNLEASALGFVPQRTALSDRLPVTVRDVVAIGTWGRLGAWRRPNASARRAVRDALARMELSNLATRPFAALSGGQRQRALLAQALARGAELLLLDEPTTGLDRASGERIRTVLHEQAATGAAVVCVSHDPTLIEAAHRIVALEAGRVV